MDSHTQNQRAGFSGVIKEIVSTSQETDRDAACSPEHAERAAVGPVSDMMVEARPVAGASRYPRISVVIPAMNEAENLPYVFSRLPDNIYEVILVDGHSVDGTMGVARRLRRTVRLVRQSGRGKGNALACGFAAARGDIIVMLDADGSTDPAEIPDFVAALLDGADFAKGSRSMPGGGSDDITRIRAIGNRLLTASVNILYRAQFTDLCYGYNAFWRHCLDRVVIDCDGFEVETLMNIRAAKSGLTVAEVPSHEACRINGVSNLRALPDGWRVGKTILRERFRGPAEPVLVGFHEIPGDWDGTERRNREVQQWTSTALETGVERLSDDGRYAVTTIPSHTPWLGASTSEIGPARPSTSVIVCTYSDQRLDDLRACLAALQAQRAAPDEVIVVVDSNPRLARRLRDQIPGVAVLEHTGPAGLSGARNAGLVAARGEIVAFIDDDAVARPDWLEQLIEGYRDETVVAVGGYISPLWPRRRPSWFPEEFDWVVGCSYRGLPDSQAEVRNLIGCNMSFRRAALLDAGGFRTEMGRMGLDTAGCEETEACIRVGAAGGRIVFRPEAIVSHRIAPNRVPRRYFVSRCLGEGRSKARVARLVGAESGLSSERAYTLRVLPSGVLRALGAAGKGDPAGLARAAMIVAGLLCTGFGYALHSLRPAVSSVSAPILERREMTLPADARR